MTVGGVNGHRYEKREEERSPWETTSFSLGVDNEQAAPSEPGRGS